MGDPKFIRKKYAAPPHPWQRARIEEEKIILKEYGLKNKNEVWRMKTKAKKFADQAKMITAQETPQSKKEEEQMLAKLYRLNLLPKGATIDDVLGLKAKDILERRLQTIVFKKGFAKSIKQARQFITHRHILVGEKVVTSPAHIVSLADESRISFLPKSPLFSAEHPERIMQKEIQKGKPAHADKPAKEEKKEKPGKKGNDSKEEKKAEPKAEAAEE